MVKARAGGRVGGMAKNSEFDTIDRQIELLQERLDACRQAMALSRAAVVVAVGTLVLVLTVAGAWRTPAVVFTAIAAAIGGTVWLGASRTSRDETEAELAALDRTKARLIDEVAARNGWRDLTPTVH